MINFDNALGQRTLQRIKSEQVVWLTTVSPSGFPQPRPVWFVWDDQGFVIYSTPKAKKLAHIASNPKVALHFNTNSGGEDVQVILGNAFIDQDAPLSKSNTANSEKYHSEILALGLDKKKYSATFSVALRIVPTRLRGLEPIPETQ